VKKIDIKLSLEDKFIIHCLHSKFGRIQSDSFSDLDITKINWTEIYQKSMGLLVTPIIYDYIKNHSNSLNGIVPEKFVNDIEKVYLSIFLDNLKNRENLSRLIRKIRAADIEIILLKGAHLLEYVYDDIALRSMGDVDILIKKEDLPYAEKIILENGYKFKDYNDEVSGHQNIEDRLKASERDLSYISINGYKLLEVHWTIKLDIDSEEIWQNSEEKLFEGEKIKILSYEDLVLHLCFNTCIDHKLTEHKLKPYCDFAAIINKAGASFNWNDLLKKANRLSIEKYLYIFFLLSRDLIGAKVPDDMLKILKPENFHQKILAEAKKRLLSTKRQAIYYANELKPGKSLFKKGKFILQRIFIPKNEVAELYSIDPGSKLIYYFYLKRIIRLFNQYLPFFLNQVVKSKKKALNENLDLWMLPAIAKNKM
jgi:hypothetical protein